MMRDMAFAQAGADFQRHLEDGTPFPLILTPTGGNKNDVNSLVSSAKENFEWVDSILAKAGAVLFRGFNVETVEDFNEFVEAFGWEEYNYGKMGGQAIRTPVFKRVSTVNDSVPLDQQIGLHSEACYAKEFPTRVIFFCATAPEPGTGGETPIAHGHSVYKRLLHEHKPLLDKLVDKHLKLIPETSDPRSATFPAFQKNRVGELAWFNQFGPFVINFKNVGKPGFGDGTLLLEEEVEACMGILEELTVKFAWNKGDILMIDNTAALHGREPCNGTVRSIFVSLTK